jgi:sugar lactone lactonase YvrE
MRSVRVSRAILPAVIGLASAAGVVVWMTRARPGVPPPSAPPPRWPVVVTTLARGTTPAPSTDAPPADGFSEPFGVAEGPAGSALVSDGDRNAIYLVDPDGRASLFAGGREGFDDGQATFATFRCPSGLATTASGALVVADTGNNAIRLVAHGQVTTLAGDGVAGSDDGIGRAARFNGPIGVAVAPDASIVVADTYNDRIRRIAPDGRVTTVAGGSGIGLRDGTGVEALFDTPSGVAVGAGGEIFVADTGNDALRRIGPGGEVTTVGGPGPAAESAELPVQIARPVGVAVSAGYLYVTDANRVLVLAPDGSVRIVAGSVPGYADGGGDRARFRGPTGIAVDGRGLGFVADGDNDLVRRLVPVGPGARMEDVDLDPTPLVTPSTLNLTRLPWPLSPQDGWHELAATLGEARGSGRDERARLHTGIDVRGIVGEVARAVRDEMVQRPISTGRFGDPNEALRVGLVSYVHIRVGRGWHDRLLDPDRFAVISDETGRRIRVRVKRGTRFHAGDAIGTLNRLSHVHLDVGPRGAEVNPLAFGLPAFQDTVPPVIPAGGIDLYDEGGTRLTERTKGRVIVSGRVSIVAEAFDRANGNTPSRRLGVYSIGYQVLSADGSPAPGFESPREAIRFDRLPEEPDAPWLVYAEGSGITAYGNRRTRFRYIVTHDVRDGHASGGLWDTTSLAPGPYAIRITARDWSGNAATRDLAVMVVPPASGEGR